MKKNNIELDDEGNLSNNSADLRQFTLYCLDHPQQRFWQALRNWSQNSFILTAENYDFDKEEYVGLRDTFYE
jgi:hypothetical protein